MGKHHRRTIEYVGLSIVIVAMLGFLFMVSDTHTKKAGSGGPAYAGEPAPVSEERLRNGPPPAPELAPVDAEQELATRPPVN